MSSRPGIVTPSIFKDLEATMGLSPSKVTFFCGRPCRATIGQQKTVGVTSARLAILLDGVATPASVGGLIPARRRNCPPIEFAAKECLLVGAFHGLLALRRPVAHSEGVGDDSCPWLQFLEQLRTKLQVDRIQQKQRSEE